MDRAEFTGAVERASIVAKDAQYNVINFIVADDQIKLMSQHPDYGTVEDYVPCHLEGQGLDISFNGKFILDILKHCYDSEVILKSKENSPMLVQDKEDTSCVFVVTPEDKIMETVNITTPMIQLDQILEMGHILLQSGGELVWTKKIFVNGMAHLLKRKNSILETKLKLKVSVHI